MEGGDTSICSVLIFFKFGVAVFFKFGVIITSREDKPLLISMMSGEYVEIYGKQIHDSLVIILLKG